MRTAFLDFVARFFLRYPKTFITGVILYIVFPYDLIPEAIVGPIGYIDDFLVLLLPFLLRHYIRRRKLSLNS